MNQGVLTQTRTRCIIRRPQQQIHLIGECQSEAAIVVWQAMRDTPDVADAGATGMVAGRSTIRMTTG